MQGENALALPYPIGGHLLACFPKFAEDAAVVRHFRTLSER